MLYFRSIDSLKKNPRQLKRFSSFYSLLYFLLCKNSLLDIYSFQLVYHGIDLRLEHALCSVDTFHLLYNGEVIGLVNFVD